MREQPRREPFGGAPAGVAGEDAVDVDAVDRGDAEPPPVDGRRVGDRADDHLAAHLAGIEQGREPGGGVDAGELAAVHARGDDGAGARPGPVDEGQRDVDGERAESDGDGAAGLGAGRGAQGADGEGGSHGRHASVRPRVERKPTGRGEVPSSARSAAMPPKAGESLKPWPENPASRTTFSAPGRGPTRGRLLAV